MTDAIETYLEIHGPCLSSDVAKYLTENLKISSAAARKRVSRTSSNVKRLAYITFPRGSRFMYLQQQFGSPYYWTNLVKALLETNSAYGLAIAALCQRGGIIPLGHFAISCGAPIKQAKHLSPETVFKRLNEASLLQKKEVSGLGECITLAQEIGYYDWKAEEVRARLVTENILLAAVHDWLRNLGIISYDKVKTRQSKSLPMVGTFAWDLTAPSYLGFMVRSGKNGSLNPGFVVCDVLLGETITSDGIRPFINKCKTLRTLRRVGPCMQIFIASKYDKEAFGLLKRNGIIPATPQNLFGEEVALGFGELFSVLRNAAHAVIDPEKFTSLFQKLGKIEGAAIQLRGTLFEYLVADVARRTISPQIQMNRVFKSEDKQKEAEADVIAVRSNHSIKFIECKGYNPNSQIPDKYVERWLQHNVPTIFNVANTHPDWKNLEMNFEFWATGSISKEALEMIEAAKKRIKPSRYTIDVLLGSEIKNVFVSTKEKPLIEAFEKHFMKKSSE